jgi:hypothetical protein
MSALASAPLRITVPTIPLDRLQNAAKTAMSYFKVTPGQYGIEMDELVNVGWVAVAEAVPKHDPKRGTIESFTFINALWAMRGYIEDAMGLKRDYTADKYTMVRKMIPWTDTGLQFGQDTHSQEDMG